jgi:hypothetical protein
MKKRTPHGTRKACAASRARSKASSNVPPRHRRKASVLRTARTSGVAGARVGTVSGRSRKKPRRKAPARTKARRRQRAEKLFGVPPAEAYAHYPLKSLV